MISTQKWIVGTVIDAVVITAATAWLATVVAKEHRREALQQQSSRIFRVMTDQCQQEKEVADEAQFRKMPPEMVEDRRMLNYKACECKSHHVLDKASGDLSDEVIKGLFSRCVERAVNRQWD